MTAVSTQTVSWVSSLSLDYNWNVLQIFDVKGFFKYQQLVSIIEESKHFRESENESFMKYTVVF